MRQHVRCDGSRMKKKSSILWRVLTRFSKDFSTKEEQNFQNPQQNVTIFTPCQYLKVYAMLLASWQKTFLSFL